MDDLTLERPTAALVPPRALLEYIATRERQHRVFVARADAWAKARAGGGPVVVVYPDDAEAVAWLGVPCDDCLALVHRQGEAGHEIRFYAANGQHWASLISAHCGRRPA